MEIDDGAGLDQTANQMVKVSSFRRAHEASVMKSANNSEMIRKK